MAVTWADGLTDDTGDGQSGTFLDKTEWQAFQTDINNNLGGAPDYVKVSEEQPNTTDGGAITNGAWRTRNLNTLNTDTAGIATVVANQFTLEAGTYDGWVLSTSIQTGRHNVRLRNITDGATVFMGTGQWANGDACYAIARDRFTITTITTFEIQMRTERTVAGAWARGYAMNFGETEIYAQGVFKRIAT